MDISRRWAIDSALLSLTFAFAFAFVVTIAVRVIPSTRHEMLAKGRAGRGGSTESNWTVDIILKYGRAAAASPKTTLSFV